MWHEINHGGKNTRILLASRVRVGVGWMGVLCLDSVSFADGTFSYAVTRYLSDSRSNAPSTISNPLTRK